MKENAHNSHFLIFIMSGFTFHFKSFHQMLYMSMLTATVSTFCPTNARASWQS
ncbi:MAG TPA: hypothetical protein GXZ40_03715 [Bacteroidales bacterium]|nr:hypothetical protein [Bacteroidales bacterium]